MTDILSREQVRAELDGFADALLRNAFEGDYRRLAEKAVAFLATCLAVMDERDSHALTIKLMARNHADEKSGVAAFTKWLSHRYPMEAGRECFDVARDRIASLEGERAACVRCGDVPRQP